MSREDIGDRGDLITDLVGEVVVDGEVEWDGAPEGHPPLGEDGCPKGGLCGEVGDDDSQHLVGKAADEVEGGRRLFRIWVDPPLFLVRLGLHLSRRRHPQPVSPQLE